MSSNPEAPHDGMRELSPTSFPLTSTSTIICTCALMYGSVNSASVVSKFGATEGQLSFDEIEERLKTSPDYTYLIG